MSVEAISWVLHNVPVSGTEKVVLLGIANHADPTGRNAWPSIATLAKYAAVSERSVRDALRRLEEGGHVVTELQKGGYEETRHDRRPNRYTIPGVVAPGSDGRKSTAPRGESREEADRSPFDDDGGKPAAAREEAERFTGGSQLPPNRPSTVLEPTDDDDRENNSRGNGSSEESSSSDFDAVVRVLARLALANAKKAGTHIASETGWLKGTRGNIADEQETRICDLMRDGLTVPEIAYEMIPDPALARWAMRQEGVAHLSEVAS